MLSIFPLSYLDQTAIKEGGDEIIVPKRIFERWLDRFPPGMPLLARLTNSETEDSCVVCLGGQDTVNECIFAPNRILASLQGASEVHIEPVEEELPSATKLHLRMMDMRPIDGVDLRQAVEDHLDTYHVLALGTTLSIPIKELADTEVEFYVEDIEPAPLVRLGGEVILNILSEPEPEVVPEVIPEIIPEQINTVVETPPSLSAEEVRLKRLQFFTKNSAPTPADAPLSSAKSLSDSAPRISEST
jgi:hypothetical protein